MSASVNTIMTAGTAIQPDDFEARVTKIVKRILARNKRHAAREELDREIALVERSVRVEAVLKLQGEALQQIIARSEKRIEEMQEEANRRLEERRAESSRQRNMLKTITEERPRCDKHSEEMRVKAHHRREERHAESGQQSSGIKTEIDENAEKPTRRQFSTYDEIIEQRL